MINKLSRAALSLAFVAVVPTGLYNAASAQTVSKPSDTMKSVGKTIEWADFENHADPKLLMDLLRRRNAIEARAGGSGKARFWQANLCGNSADHMFILTEFSTAEKLADERQRADSAQEIRQWEADAETAGFSLKSRVALVNLKDSRGPISPITSPTAPPRTLQFTEFDLGENVKQWLDGMPAAEVLIRKFAGEDDGNRSYWGIGWAGEHAHHVVALVDFPSHASMIRTVNKVDFTPEFGELMQRNANLGAKRVFECVMTEVRP